VKKVFAAAALPLALAFLALVLPGAARADAGGCLAHHPIYVEDSFEIQYTQGCTGHDEPELDPLSNLAGSARDLTWTVVLPSNGTYGVDATGPTFWFGGTVTDPRSAFGQAFVELQFYPNGLLTNCNPNGAFILKEAPGVYTVCSPVWSVIKKSEPAAFNAMLTPPLSTSPLVMHAGDTLTIHWFTTSANDGYHVTVTDLSTGGQGTIVLNSKSDGPLMPAFDKQQLGNALGWGLVDDAPNSFVWEIGHTSPFTSPASEFCVPGQTFCESYHDAAWAGTSPIQIKSVTFADGSQAKQWAVVSDFGGRAEVNQYCGAANYGKPYCIYPWYTLGSSGFHYGVDFPDTVKDYGKVDQFQQTTQCGGPFGPDSTYCATVLH
jgi:hypothetical protein